MIAAQSTPESMKEFVQPWRDKLGFKDGGDLQELADQFETKAKAKKKA